MSLYDEIFKLKNTIRRDWLIRDVDKYVPRVESDAEHTFSMIITAIEVMSKTKKELNQLKVLKMIAFHELCEIDAGDITPSDNISSQEKYQKEFACIQRLADEYNMPEIKELWLEFEENKTPEAQFARNIDKYDAIKQSKIYAEKTGNEEIYKSFHEYNYENNFVDEFDKLDL